jgi:hypothetical protein
MRLDKNNLIDILILSSRVLLSWTLLNYGYGKISGNQFGVSQQELSLPLKEVGLYRLSWFLFDHQPFKFFIGISQIISGLLILYNRTLIIGIFISIPIFLNILVIDITYIQQSSFVWRLSWYLFLDTLILWYYRDKIFLMLKNITNGITLKYKYPIWILLIIPILSIGLDFFIFLLKYFVDKLLSF